ncbi:pupal cuticle protein PCP52-like [Ostrinia furnacalis]|uniref:pupal cuticle protein PCP52-like n=1 Tax=Ostrinia furnacalis TaxID=93504 RepID=UPI00103AF5F4|nr:pupal cuticle protein PCP52-like [Ostrinia furnacalis]
MAAISSRTSSTMRVLILSAALLACATAAPSGSLIAPISPIAPVVAVPAVNSGDLQAALIDAKVQTEDYLRSIADKNREVVEEVVVDHNEKVIEANDQAKERSLEAFWANEDKKWQALNAAQTAQAQLDGELARDSDAAAKFAAAVSAVAQPVSPLFYTQGFVTPNLKVAEAPKEENKAEKVEEAKSDSVQVESANVKTAEASAESPKPEPVKIETPTKYIVGQTPLLSTYPIVPTLKFVPQIQPWGSVAYVQPALNTVAAVPYPGQVLAPTVLKTVW